MPVQVPMPVDRIEAKLLMRPRPAKVGSRAKRR